MESRLANSLARKFFLRILKGLPEGCVELVEGAQTYHLGSPASETRAVLAVHNERFYLRAALGGSTGIGEAYMDGDWSTPDLVGLLRLGVRNIGHLEAGSSTLSSVRRLLNRIQHRQHKNTLAGSRRNIAAHYDLGNSFYRLFLDENLAYSSAYFGAPEDSLDRAQIRKFDLICRKLQLGPREHLLEIGTGWGGFAAYAASAYGCRITTTTISQAQHEYARERFAQMGEAARGIELLNEDYRQLRGQYDRIVSIEMFEAVGLEHYDDFFGACDRLLRPGGAMLLQAITMNERRFPTYHRGSDWIQKYIFPGAELASLSEVLRSLGRVTQMGLHHLEDIGMHYAATLREWRSRFLNRLEEVRELGYSDRFLRMWDYYLAYCEAGFHERYIGDVQLLLTKLPNLRALWKEPAWLAEAMAEESSGEPLRNLPSAETG
jgi:cyclopropane-fatty-acyl-phospholipid synthase